MHLKKQGALAERKAITKPARVGQNGPKGKQWQSAITA